jgi:hypothetical protein
MDEMHEPARQACNRNHLRVVILRSVISDPRLHIEASNWALVDERGHGQLFFLRPHNVDANERHQNYRADEQNILPIHRIHPSDKLAVKGGLAGKCNCGCLPNVFYISDGPNSCVIKFRKFTVVLREPTSRKAVQ